jgi:hypothetical protein
MRLPLAAETGGNRKSNNKRRPAIAGRLSLEHAVI